MLKGNCRVLSSCIVVLLLGALLTGCKGTASLPEQAEFPDVFSDELPQGPANISGRIVVTTPELLINGSSAEPTLEFDGILALIVAGKTNIGRSLGNVKVRPQPNGNGTNWVIPFAFINIPFGQYEVRLLKITEQVGAIYYEVFWASEPVSVSNDQPSKRMGDLPYAMFDAEDTGAFAGNILVDGFAVPNIAFELNDNRAFEISGNIEIDSHNPFHWHIPNNQDDNGRLTYEVRGLEPVSYRFGTGQIINGNVAEPIGSWALVESLNTATVVNLLTQASFLEPIGNHPGHLPEYGSITVHWNIDKWDWDGDLVLVVEKVGGADNSRHLHRHFITKPAWQETGADGHRVGGLDVSCGYTVKVLLLGDNPGDAQLVAEYPGIVELVRPDSDPPGTLNPEAEITLDIELE